MVRFLTAVIFGIALLVLFFWTTDLTQMISSLKRTNHFYLILGLAAYFASIWFRTIRWRFLLLTNIKIKTSRLLPVVVVGYMANNILPFRIGELVRSYYLNRREGISTTTGISTILVERVSDSIALLFLIGVTAVFVPLDETLSGFSTVSNIAESVIVIFFVLPFLGMFTALVAASLFRNRTERIIYKVSEPLSIRIRNMLRDSSSKVLDGLQSLNSISAITKVLALSLPVWIAESFLFFFVALSLDIHSEFEGMIAMASASILVTGITNIGSSVPAAPGGLGLFELIARESLVLMPHGTVSRPDAAAFAALTHACLLIPIIALGQMFLWANGLSLLSLSRRKVNPLVD